MILADHGCGFLCLVNTVKFSTMSADEAIALRERIMDVIKYNPSTGLFMWKKRPNSRCHEGWFAGSKCSAGYTQVCVFGNRMTGHQVAWLIYYGSVPRYEIDHKNRDKSDNRISNLRDISHIKNSRNRNRSKLNTSGYTGVYFSKSENKWNASIHVDYRKINLGRFSTREEAIVARQQAELKHGFSQDSGARC